MRNRSVRPIALGGVLSAASTVLMMFGSAIPFATFVVPCIASLSVLFFCIEYGMRTAVLVYLSVSVLSILLSADKELALVFVFITGLYPVVRVICERIPAKGMRTLTKLLYFNASVFLLYTLITRVFIIASVREELEEFTLGFTVVLMALANITFLLYDLNLTRLTAFYRRRVHPRG